MLKFQNFQFVRSMLIGPDLTGNSENINLATRSRLRTYLAMNLWMRRRLDSLSMEVGIDVAFFIYLITAYSVYWQFYPISKNCIIFFRHEWTKATTIKKCHFSHI